MGKLDELIKELCPNGVEYIKVDSLCETQTPIIKIKSKAYLKEGVYPVIDQGQEFIGGYTNEEGVFPEDEYVIFGDHTCVVKYINFSFAQGADGVKVLKADTQRILSKYFYYCMSNINLDASYARHWSKMRIQKIPVPPLEVQREIVRILDSFTLLTAELTAELTARKKQYNYYRDMLLTFNEVEHLRKVKLSEVCEVYDGTHQTPRYVSGGVPFVSVENIDDIYGTTKYISYEDYDKYKVKPKMGDVFMTRITAGVIGKCAVVTNSDNLAYYVSLALLRPNQQVLDSFYLKYYLESSLGKRELSKRILWDATPTKINKEDIGKIIITIPTLDVQKRIVNVLNNFDAICSDLNIGLPAEIKAKQKQYEYYREKLLNFKELSI